MGLKLLDLVFRHRLLLILPVLLGIAVGLVYMLHTEKTEYVSKASVWVDKPSDFSGTSLNDYNAYDTPAQNQASSMTELLGTKSFVLGVLKELGAPDSPPPVAFDLIRNNTSIIPYGNHVLFVEYRAPSPGSAAATVNAIVDQYSLYYTGKVQQSASRAASFYNDQLDVASKAVDAASSDLSAYIAKNPKLANVSLDNPPSTALADLEFARLLQTRSAAIDNYNKVLDQYAAAEISTNTAAANTATFFAVLDPPEKPLAPAKTTKRKLLTIPALGLALGLFVSGGLLIVMWRSDRTVRLTTDIDSAEWVPVVALPRLKARGRWPQDFVRVAAALQSGRIGPGSPGSRELPSGSASRSYL